MIPIQDSMNMHPLLCSRCHRHVVIYGPWLFLFIPGRESDSEEVRNSDGAKYLFGTHISCKDFQGTPSDAMGNPGEIHRIRWESVRVWLRKVAYSFALRGDNQRGMLLVTEGGKIGSLENFL